ncbi:MAG: twin-arginine translocation signal domain-containing protein [Microthrixaceae bacterium]
MPSVLDRTVNFLSDRLDRRNFLGKAAVVGSAIVTAPLEFGLKPRSAYAAVCNCNGSNCPCGSLCCDGYTEFCCTLNGANACPPGTITAGWWKVDGSQFCGGAARYYLDCNAQCGSCDCGANGVCSGACSGTGCGCAQGNCNNRKAGCTRFRYGQCNQGVRCVGPIVCRVVTCAPPWTFDPACGTSSRTDEATRFHDRPCLNDPFGTLEQAIDVGSAIRLTGWAVANSDYQRAGVRFFLDTDFVYHGVADRERLDVRAAYPAFGPNTGYDATILARPGKRLVCAWGVDRRTGRSAILGMREVVVAGARGQINKMFDLGGGTVRVQGWAMDPTGPDKMAMVRYRVDGREWWRGRPAVNRPDVVAAIPGAPLRSGYSVDVPVPQGRHSICVDLIDAWGQVTTLGCRTLDVVGEPFGRYESVTDLGGGQVRVRGWVIDPLLGAGPARVRILVGNTVVTTVTASANRPDVGADHPRFGANHGFDVTVAAAAGSRQVCVQVLHGGGTTTAFGCKTVTVTS